MKTITVQDAVDFVLLHRRDKVFRGQSEAQIKAAINRAMFCNAFGYVQDAAGRLLGLCVATPNKIEKTLRVNHILCIQPRVIPTLLKFYWDRWGGFTITAKRRGKERVYDTSRLTRKLERT